MSLTTVFGMGTGVPSSPLTRTYFLVNKKVSKENFNVFFLFLIQGKSLDREMRSHLLALLPYRPPLSAKIKFGDPWGNRTPVCGVRGRRLNRLTNGPFLPAHASPVFPGTTVDIGLTRYPQRTVPGTPSRARTVDPLIKSQLLYQLS